MTRCLQTRKRSLVSCLHDMIPVNPRRQAEYRFPDISKNHGNNVNDQTDDDNNDMFSLFMTSPRLAMMPRTIIDMKVVIVGASDCGIAFAEYLALRYTYKACLCIGYNNSIPSCTSPSLIISDSADLRSTTCSLRILRWYRPTVCRLIISKITRGRAYFHSEERSARNIVVAWPRGRGSI